MLGRMNAYPQPYRRKKRRTGERAEDWVSLQELRTEDSSRVVAIALPSRED
jgi:hypothetical protein